MDRLARYTIVELFDLLARETDDKRAKTYFTEVFKRSRDELALMLKLEYKAHDEQVVEALNDVFLDVWLKRHKLQAVKSPNAWLLRVAHHKMIDILGKDEKEKQQMAKYVEDRLRDPENDPLNDNGLENRIGARLDEAIGRLPRQQQRIFNMAKVEEQSIKQIAESLGRRESGIKNLLGAAKKKLRGWLSAFRKGGWQ